MGNLVRKINHVGKKGDTLHLPSPTRGAASSKAAETQVTLNNPATSEITVSINKHYEYSVLIEDITNVQALSSLRRFYTADAGYALAKQVDTDLVALGASLQGSTAYSTAVIGGDGTTVWNPAAATNTGNGTALTDAGIRAAMQVLDDADVPMMGRVFLLPPVEKNVVLGIDRFVLWTNVGEGGPANSIRNGLIGDIYGMNVYVSTQAATVVATDTTTNYRACLMFSPDAFVFAEQMGVRSQSQYIQQYLADLFTADTIYGVAELRDNAGIALIVPA